MRLCDIRNEQISLKPDMRYTKSLTPSPTVAIVGGEIALGQTEHGLNADGRRSLALKYVVGDYVYRNIKSLHTYELHNACGGSFAYEGGTIART